MDLKQALSLRKQLLVSKIIQETSKRLTLKWNQIYPLYLNGQSIKKITFRFDLPAVATLRQHIQTIVFEKEKDNKSLKYRDLNVIIKSILREDNDFILNKYLSKRDQTELKLAKKLDQLSFNENDEDEREDSQLWENSLYSYLNNLGIKYIPEAEMKKKGYASTPDVLLMDDLYINNRLVRWIDSKNYYGSTASRRFMQSAEKQSSKYEEAFFGPGAIIYRLGFSSELSLKLNNVLTLDQGDLQIESNAHV